MEQARKIKVGISIGDPNGIGIEVILKTFQEKELFDFFTPILYGNMKLISFQKRHLNLKTSLSPYKEVGKLSLNQVNVLDVWSNLFTTEFGKSTEEGGQHALKSLKAATKALKENKVDVLVTAPIDKHNIQSESFKFPGHTDYLSKELGGKSLMFMITEGLKVGLLTDHVPVSEVAQLITPERIDEKVSLMTESLKKDFGISKPKIGVLGINPHTGDQGIIGKEDDEVLRPTLKKLYEKGDIILGPYAADSFFGAQTHTQFDAILAVYHDQGLIPFKTLSFGQGVNYTAGLSKVRTSPDHGTAFEIAGKGEARIDSFKEALFAARDIYFERRENENLRN
ncbi:MAG: 4-hydroxythreonine-4-phosphate dehydrogenase PdxA [Flavobacteriales bacterium]|nr:4-hydroxythreonine-4-phosphate dehydrogenase PdxA [Candidatus Arcticimaribacter sp.]|tara:strand:+ start:4933 stop:5949 length:1017 start_codon:yes stop_codon:yes gene_type:complete